MRSQTEITTFQAILIVTVAGVTSMLIAVGRAVSAAQFGRSLRAARVSAPTTSPADHGPDHAGDLA